MKRCRTVFIRIVILLFLVGCGGNLAITQPASTASPPSPVLAQIIGAEVDTSTNPITILLTVLSPNSCTQELGDSEEAINLTKKTITLTITTHALAEGVCSPTTTQFEQVHSLSSILEPGSYTITINDEYIIPFTIE